MKIIFGCEESQECTIAFRKKGHDAYSCDLQPCSGGHPEWHIKQDILEVIKGGSFALGNDFKMDEVTVYKWDMGVFFPDCTFLTISANKWYKDQPPRKSGKLVGAERRKARKNAIDFALELFNCGIEKVGMENPIGVLSTVFRKPDQVLQPWMFGHGETKATCLWLKGLSKLTPTNIVPGRKQRLHELSPSKNRAKLRSKTFPGIAQAMANQWG